MQRRGFSLLELSMVLVVSGLMLGFLTQMTSSVDAAQCYTSTKTQIITINEAIQRFARKNDRLPMPAARNIGIEDINYGREALAAAIDQAGGVSFGALPFQALGLSPTMAGDCWGNKFTYMVTTALTTNASSGGYLDSTVEGNIARKNNSGGSADAKIAYAVVSHGMDELGSVELNYTGVSKGWCGGASNLKSMNCRAATAEVADAVFNDGKNAAANYFDDLVLAGGKPKILNDIKSNAYCWGYNGNGEVGDNTNTTPVTSPTLVSGGIQFAQISTGSDHTCGLDITGKAYCWGANTYHQLGDGTNTTRLKPTAVNGGLTFKMIRAGYGNTCALTNAGAAYCWGYNGSGGLGLGHTGIASSPGLVTGGLNFADITVGFTDQCGVTTAGVGYCWGYNEQGQLGVGDTVSRNSPTLVSGGLTFKQIKAAYDLSCGITTAGDAYCWGYNGYGQLGDGSTSTSYVPVAVSGGIKFKEIHLQGYAVCGLSTDDVTYCWGDNQYNNLGKNTGVAYYTTPQTQAVGSPTFIQLTTQFFGGCGLTSDYKVYCWGRGNYGQIGNSGTSNAAVPTLVSGGGTAPYAFGTLGIRGHSSSTICALQPLPPAAWGLNSNGQVGDSSNTDRYSPVYITMPSGVNYFKYATESPHTRCAISDLGKAYCWGLNDYGQIGDGTSGTNKNKPTAVTMPGAVTFTSIHGRNRWATCAIGNDNRPYCWGVGYYYGYGSSPIVPTLLPIPPVTINKINMNSGAGAYVGSNNQGYSSNGWSGVALVTPLPGGVTSVKEWATQAGGGLYCILGNDDWVYCSGESGAYSAIGDGSTSGSTGTLTPVTPPSGVTTFKSLAVGNAGGGWGYGCAIGNDDEGYCWGFNNLGVLANGVAGAYYVPTKVTRPTGVNKWKTILAKDDITILLGDDGNWYFSGLYVMEAWDGGTRTHTPTKLPLPPGASGWRSVDGRIGIPY
jgi:prepilin-type N-terminal cleavage/methylation domain-containing protein